MLAPEADPHANLSNDYAVSRPRAWFAFAMIFLLMLSDYIDRQIVVSLFPHLKDEWGLSDKQLGALVSVISVVVAVGGLPVALMADRFGRVKGIVAMASVWSMATIACMFARNYGQLFAARAVVGLGETGYGAVGSALVNGLFPRRLHSTLLGAFFAASALGAVLGVMLGGFIADHWGWRAAFGAVGFPGLIMALLFMLVPDYKSVMVKFAPQIQSRSPGAFIKRLYTALTNGPTLLWVCLAGACQLIVVSTVWAWMPSFFNRYHGMDATSAARHAALVVLCCAVGALFWGWVADRISVRRPRNKLLAMCVLTLLTFVVLTCAFVAAISANLQYALILLGSFLMTCTVGVTSSTVLNVTHPGLRATGSAVLALFQNLFGLAVGPFVGGLISDTWGLNTALAAIPSIAILSAVCFWKASRSYEVDMALVAAAVQEEAQGIEPRASIPLMRPLPAQA
ncbi:MFS transporter [Comamonas testosteroni]|uniref:MFS transporter n=1 Tax=Comamonas testosteroni TaxID=285 RepID=A0A373FAR1_COMTE|nr:MFS transporter [Comamonas testosteroni]RGE41140.1 MFS transporter [Comamonas testosteroni]